MAAAAADADVGRESLDERLVWIGERVVSGLKIKADKWRKTASAVELKTVFLQFFEVAEVRTLLVSFNERDDLVISLKFPSTLKRKSIVFLKKQPTMLTMENISKDLTWNDLGPQLLVHLAALVGDVYLPLLENQKNHERWPEVIAQDVTRHFHKLLASTSVVLSKTKGETHLPFPPNADRTYGSVETASRDKAAVHTLESVVIDWVSQIKNVLKSECDSLGSDPTYPGPAVLIQFWTSKAANLRSIYQQLQSEQAQKVAKILEVSRNTYHLAFQSILIDVTKALREAQSNSKILQAIQSCTEQLKDADEFEKLPEVFVPLFKVISLFWVNTKYMNTTHSIVLLLQLVCNDLIGQTKRFVDPGTILKSEEKDEAIEKIVVALNIMAKFRQAYIDAKVEVNSKYPGRAWRFDQQLVFQRFEAVVARLQEIMKVLRTIQDFSRLEKVEIGGTRGRILMAQVDAIYKDFQQMRIQIEEINYDILDTNEPRFSKMASQFWQSINEHEMRLGAILVQGLDDSPSLNSAFKLLDNYDTLLQRETIRADAEPKLPRLLTMFAQDLTAVYSVFKQYCHTPPLFDNMPPVAGALRWSRGLRVRVEQPLQKLEKLSTQLWDNEDAREIRKQYDMLIAEIDRFDNEQHMKWCQTVDEKAADKLKQQVLIRVNDKLAVNFDPVLVALLRESRYFLDLSLTIPDAATKIYEQNELYQQYTAKLDMTVRAYNYIMESLLPVEVPLIEARLETANGKVEKGVSHFSWKSSGLQEFIDSLFSSVTEVEKKLEALRNNVKKVKAIVEEWSKAPLLERKDPKKLLNLDEEKTRVQSKFQLVINGGTQIHKLVTESSKVVDVARTDQTWRNYVFYVNDMVVDGFTRVVRTSLEYFVKHMEGRVKEEISLLELKLDLLENQLAYTPAIDGEPGGLEEMLNDWFKLFDDTSTLMKRLDAPEFDYLTELQESEPLMILRDHVGRLLAETFAKCRTYRDKFLEFEYLWKENVDVYLHDFLAAADKERAAAQAALDLFNSQETTDDRQPPPEPPTQSQQFAAEIAKFEKLRDTLGDGAASISFGWLRVNAKPLTKDLSSRCNKRSYMLTTYLSDRVDKELDDMKQFVARMDVSLSKDIIPGDNESLVEAMQSLLAIRQRQRESSSTNVFTPLHQIVELLQQFKVKVKPEVTEDLTALPNKWEKTLKMYNSVREQLKPLVENELAAIATEETEFIQRTRDFRREFKDNGPFFFSVGHGRAYELIDEWKRKVDEIENERIVLAKRAELFEYSIAPADEVQECRNDLMLVKTLWDQATMVAEQIEEWKQTLWVAINTDAMEEVTKIFSKDIRLINKRARVWDAYSGLEQVVKNFLTVLPLVAALSSKAMRPRHWKQLMSTTGVTFTIDRDFRLDNLIELNLHEYVDDVMGIVDRAIKELSMENFLTNTLEKTWNSAKFDFGTHSSGVPLLQPSEEVMQFMEDHQLQIQNQMASKHVAFFNDQFAEWRGKLATVNAVIEVWVEVQRTWSHLESIFIGSADIRAQLPQDSKRFDSINDEFGKLMLDAMSTPNVVHCCTTPLRLEQIEGLQSSLGECEKALADYLETKRRAFPRFYFVSSPDLLDILSKGNSPTEVMKNMPKLTDDVGLLEFAQDGEGKFTKQCIGMYSKENEYVPFITPCDCTGPVEQWLNSLIDSMRSTLRHVLGEAVNGFLETNKSDWVRQYPAQVALVAGQCWWSTEVNQAFELLEDGNENALKDYSKKQEARLLELIKMIQGDLDALNRQKVMTICTIEVHARDVVAGLVRDKHQSSSCFAWQSQLRHRWDDEKEQDCFVEICDARFRYSYEYLGNQPRLVITPLTDRCYVTLTQSLHLKMGGAPAGPAGTGKTETTKDLGRGLGRMVYVFNCSDSMDYKTVGNIFKGLSMSGSWGCFDEFNRIAIEVLSVVATQVKSILDAQREKKVRFNFLGEDINLIGTVGIFITMNPGYAGRTELPENIKALFRPVSMVVPDFGLIAEIMLVAEGFLQARELAKKFTTLYGLNRDLLSKQDHYDWGLRAVKSVLVVLGGLRRAEPDLKEEYILFRGLRDFNLPKIVTEDRPVFLGLIGDLFPAIDLPRKRNEKLLAAIRTAAQTSKLQPEESFLLKTEMLDELLAVRHSVFIIGPPASSKSRIWQTLAASWRLQGMKCTYVDLNPKWCNSRELYGYMHPTTREWKNGVFSNTMRDLAQAPNKDPKWIVLDGDIDPEWIESLNTVMDDNKVLTLASNERIPLHPWMRLVFEIGHLRFATPATVSRAGILFVNETDVGWHPFLQSWLDTRCKEEAGQIQLLFEKYVEKALEYTRKSFRYNVPVLDFGKVQTLVQMLEGLVTQDSCPEGETPKEVIESLFCFCAVWALGGGLYQDQRESHFDQFNSWWRMDLGKQMPIRFPDTGTVFDYVFDIKEKKWVNPDIPEFQFVPDAPMQQIVVHTPETVRYRFFLDLFLKLGKPIMLVGPAGSGKTVLIKEKLSQLDRDAMISSTINFNYFSDSKSLQSMMEQSLEKKTPRLFGPPGTKKLVYFIDDLNMPRVDQYGTQSPVTILRQHMDYNHWYDRVKMTVKEIANVQYVASMNPSAGSFTINPRLQNHFATFSVSFPLLDNLKTIYAKILRGHLQSSGFPAIVQNLTDKLVNGSLELHKNIAKQHLPSAVKFHYQFNLRDISNVYGGLLRARPAQFKTPLQFIRLFLHEFQRVYGDRMLNVEDMQKFKKLFNNTAQAEFMDIEGCSPEEMLAEPNIACCFTMGVGGDKFYDHVPTYAKLKTLLSEALEAYNEDNMAMDLVLFNDAMEHVCRINRILEAPMGNALLVGVGGSGKQSLARLAAYISGHEVVQITISKTYGITEFKADLATMYTKAGLKSISLVFLLTDAQIVHPQFLVYMNDFLSTGNVPDLFAQDERDPIINGMRGEVKMAGLIDTPDVCWEFFLEKVRRNLHVVLCFSPVGEDFRVRGRRFPALFNCVAIDWFHSWPEEALLSVATSFLADAEIDNDELKQKAAQFMAYAQQAVGEVAEKYKAQERRFYYTTPKSYLELISFYKGMLQKKRAKITADIERLENGLIRLRATSEDVAKLQIELLEQQKVVDRKKIEADALLERVGRESAIVEGEQAKASVEEEKMSVQAAAVSAQQADCARDLEAAEPAIIAANAALATLNKPNLTELKSFGKPPGEIVNVMAVVMYLCASPKTGLPKDVSWNAAKKMMANVDGFLRDLQTFDKDHVPQANIDKVTPMVNAPDFNGKFLASKSQAAAGICEWARNIAAYDKIYKFVQPKREALSAANELLKASQAKLKIIQDQVALLNKKLKKLTDEFEAATEEKNRVIAQAEATEQRMTLARRLVNGLASENVRWANQIDLYHEEEQTLAGDVLIASAFVSYIGGFSRSFREMLQQEYWLPFMKKIQMPMSNTDPVKMLISGESEIAKWSQEALPIDPMSVQNAAIFTNAVRWPLIIDPQLQGVKWIRTRYGSELKIIRLNSGRYMDALEHAISNGDVVLFENISENMDAVLDPVLGRMTSKKGRVIKLGDKEVDYNKNFKLILQTKIANPHYKPEYQAQLTLINFTVTEDGLEDQLLALVVNKERPDLEQMKADLLAQQNEFKIKLKELEDDLLSRLANAKGDILADVELIDNLELTKRTSTEIMAKVEKARETEIMINKNREAYRPVAGRASMMYFLLNDLWKINQVYHFSLKAFLTVFFKAMQDADPVDDQEAELAKRVENLIESVTFRVYNYTRRGLFERHKLIFAANLCFKVLNKRGELPYDEFDNLLKGKRVIDSNPLNEWLQDANWEAIAALRELDAFQGLHSDMQSSSKRWKEWAESEKPEQEKLPQDWKNKSALQRLLILRALRPDRMTIAVNEFVSQSIGARFVESIPTNLQDTLQEASAQTPLLFILSPGSDPVKALEVVGRKLGFTEETKKYRNVSLGQGQEPVAERAIDDMFVVGGWVMLQNIHLTRSWLPMLEKKMETILEEMEKGDAERVAASKDFRLFLSAEPNADPTVANVPAGIVQNCIKITNEPPEGIKANMRRALANFNQDVLESCSKQNEFRSILFSLCFFHGTILERRKFGPQGWNIPYNFNNGDLMISVDVLFNYLETNPTVPWDDLRYIFGEIMYGGHISDDWDRRLCATYLQRMMRPELLEDMDLAPGFGHPGPRNYDEYKTVVDEDLPADSPVLFGMHPNAEIMFLTQQSEALFATIVELQPRGGTGGGAASRDEAVKDRIADFLDRLPETFDMIEMYGKVEDRTPYTTVCLQECDRMNILLKEIARSLKELRLGIDGDLTMTESMDTLFVSLFNDQVPAQWAKAAYASLKSLTLWFADLLKRHKQLEKWSGDLNLPSSVWLPGLFNPQSMLTAILQSTARKNQWPLDKMVLATEATKKVSAEEITSAPREGAYVHGLFCEGARWDTNAGMLKESVMKELYPLMPVMFIKAVPRDKAETKDIYNCPVYVTRRRGPTFVWTFGLKTKEPEHKWILAGVALLLQDS